MFWLYEAAVSNEMPRGIQTQLCLSEQRGKSWAPLALVFSFEMDVEKAAVPKGFFFFFLRAFFFGFIFLLLLEQGQK